MAGIRLDLVAVRNCLRHCWSCYFDRIIDPFAEAGHEFFEAMKSLLISLLITGLLSACGSHKNVSEELHKLQKSGFTAENINGAHLSREQRLQPDSGTKFAAQVLSMIEHAAPHHEHSGMGDASARYELQLFIGSTFASERLTIRVASDGEGWFQRGNGRKTWFFSPDLAALLAKQRMHHSPLAAMLQPKPAPSAIRSFPSGAKPSEFPFTAAGR